MHNLFVWRLKVEEPKIIIIGVDTMVLDNDDSLKKEGCENTYKKKKGFQPLNISWGPFLIDVMFRNGKAHSNHCTDYTDRVKVIVELIRKRYSTTIPIMLCSDSGFSDQKAFDIFDSLNISFITTNRIYKEDREYAEQLNSDNYSNLTNVKII